MIEEPDCVYKLGQRIRGKVETILSYGIFVRLPDNQRAYIRRRELSLANDREPQEIVQLGQEIEAIVQELPRPGRTLELSHRTILSDPWEAFEANYQEGAIVAGKVKDIRVYGIFVELTPGVDGLIPHTEITAWGAGKAQDIFWLGDQIEAVITRIEPRSRKIWLSIQRRQEELAHIARIMTLLGQQVESRDALLESTRQSPMKQTSWPEDNTETTLIDSECVEQVGRILIVDDKAEICQGLAARLSRHGYCAEAVCTAREAHKKLRQTSFGLILMDIELANTSGLTVIRELQAEIAEVRVIFMSTIEKLEFYAQEIEELGAIGVLVKPLDMDEVDQMLTLIGRNETLTVSLQPAVTLLPTEINTFSEFFGTTVRGGTAEDQLHASLVQLARNVGAEAGVIFYQDPVSRAITILSQTGGAAFSQAGMYTLKESPVKDVIQQECIIWENRVATQAETRFHKLLDLFYFDSCIGIPIKNESQSHHALFLFHRQRDAFHRYHVRDALATATLAAAFIERAELNKRIQSLGKFLLSGQLTASFGHEVFNKLTGLEIQMNNLQSDMVLLGQKLAGRDDDPGFMTAQKDLGNLVETARDLRLMVESFHHLLRADDQEAVDINTTLRHVTQLARPLAEPLGIQIETTYPPRLPPIKGSSQQLQQVLFNLVINAIQHIACGEYSARRIKIEVSYETNEVERPIKIRVIDNGSGIHKQLWTKIFDLGFTSRADGSGLGLFIARSLVEAMSGKISVERSAIRLGTTFLVELWTNTAIRRLPDA